MKKFSLAITALSLVAALPFAAFAGGTTSDATLTATAPAVVTAATTPATDTMSDGEVKKVDNDAGKITIKHGPLANLEMPGMTMVFRVKDSSMLNSVKSGDKIKFVAEKVGGALTVTSLQPAK